MRRLICIAIMAFLTATVAMADSQADFNRYIKAYNSQVASRQYLPAAKSAAAASMICAEAKNYDGAFKLLSGFEKIMSERGIKADSLPLPYFYTAKARFDLYDKMNNTGQAEAWLRKMAGYARSSGSKDMATDMLFTEAKFYYGTNRPKQGDQCIARLIKQFETSNDYAAADKAYRELINKAVSANDAVLVDRTYEQYIKWSDSIEAANEASAIAKAKQEVAEADTIIAGKNHTIMTRTSLMTIFIALFVVALGCLAVGTYFYQRIRAKNQRIKKEAEEADRRTAEKSAMMQNMSSTIAPALGKLDPDNPAVREIKDYVKKVEEFSEVDAAPVKEKEGFEQVALEPFCDSIVSEFRSLLKRGATIHIDGAKGYALINPTEVRKILEHLIDNAVKFTPEGGRITLSCKKRSATTSQFIVTDSGPGIPENERENLFKAFNASRDISDGDGLGLPICALRAEKMGGSLTIDASVKGACFILTVHA
ncbi:MAG: HAMP domain-containing histidine kinase [Muribaculaceae bacterium]|nr:HAMP domain-containing histidine kinase [Muribaculaceae bacterium]